MIVLFDDNWLYLLILFGQIKKQDHDLSATAFIEIMFSY